MVSTRLETMSDSSWPSTAADAVLPTRSNSRTNWRWVAGSHRARHSERTSSAGACRRDSSRAATCRPPDRCGESSTARAASGTADASSRPTGCASPRRSTPPPRTRPSDRRNPPRRSRLRVPALDSRGKSRRLLRLGRVQPDRLRGPNDEDHDREVVGQPRLWDVRRGEHQQGPRECRAPPCHRCPHLHHVSHLHVTPMPVSRSRFLALWRCYRLFRQPQAPRAITQISADGAQEHTRTTKRLRSSLQSQGGTEPLSCGGGGI
jgi:hypothetical protein